MKTIVVLMLCVQAAMLLSVIYVVAIRRPTAGRPGPVWPGLAISLFIVGMASTNIADRHSGGAGADIVGFDGGIFIGMGLLAALLLLRRRLDGAAT
jgi:hypothetical protein